MKALVLLWYFKGKAMFESSQEKFTNIIQEQQAQWMAFANKALESSMKMLEVNIRMAKQTLVGSTTSEPDLLTLKNPAEMFSINKNQLPEAYTRMLSYAKEINAITSDLNAELGKVVQSEMSGGLKCLGAMLRAARRWGRALRAWR